MLRRPAILEQSVRSRFAIPALLFLAGICSAGDARATVVHIHEGDSFEQAAEALEPGDTLIVHAGTYSETGRLSVGVKGTEDLPVVIMAAPDESRPHITRPASAETQNTINLEGAEYLTISGLEISSNGGDGVNLNGNPAHISLLDLHIHDVDVGVNFRSSMHHIVVRGCHIHGTGRDGGTGEGLYVGCNHAACIVHDAQIEANWIHDTGGTQGDGIEIKPGSHSNSVRDNVIYDTQYPCVLVYDTGDDPPNVIEGNAIWNCGDTALQAAADAVIRNNLIFASPGDGFSSQSHQGASPHNLSFVHNTLVGGDPCVRLQEWSDKPGMIFANNAIYCDSGNFVIGGLAGVTVQGNVIHPETASFPDAGYTTGRSPELDFVAPSLSNFYPSEGSVLIDSGEPAHSVDVDFNGTPRAGTPEAGAYNWSGPQNPGWTVGPGFKGQTTPGGSAPDPPGNPEVY